MRTFNIFDLDFDYLARDPESYRAGVARIGHKVGARMIGATVYELPPGEAICPYHYHYGNEEWLVVLDGSPAVRTSDRRRAAEGRRRGLLSPGTGRGAQGEQSRPDRRSRAHDLHAQQTVGRRVSGQRQSGHLAGRQADDLLLRRDARAGYWDGE